jgi:hypothetical protein
MLDETSGSEYHSSRRARTVSSRHRSVSGCDVPLSISVANERVNVPTAQVYDTGKRCLKSTGFPWNGFNAVRRGSNIIPCFAGLT